MIDEPIKAATEPGPKPLPEEIAVAPGIITGILWRIAVLKSLSGVDRRRGCPEGDHHEHRVSAIA